MLPLPTTLEEENFITENCLGKRRMLQVRPRGLLRMEIDSGSRTSSEEESSHKVATLSILSSDEGEGGEERSSTRIINIIANHIYCFRLFGIKYIFIRSFFDIIGADSSYGDAHQI